MKVLLIEDDAALCASLVEILHPYYMVDTAQTGADGRSKGRIHEYDAVVLDMRLPDMPGAEVCHAIRDTRPDVPILILTAVTDMAQKVAMLDAGADDYVIKPIKGQELLARLRAIIRRRSLNKPEHNALQAGDLTLNVATRTVARSGKPISLRPREFDLLEYLMRNQGTVLSRGRILEHVWETDVNPLTNTVDVHIKYLRDKIDRPFSSNLIKTVPGLGYKLEFP